MNHRQPFNWVERQLQRIPTWLFVSGAVLVLAGIILWAAPDEDKTTRKGVVRVLLGGLESIAIVSAVILYFKEIPDRKTQKHYEAWQVIDASAGMQTSYARKKALENLNRDGISLRGIDIPNADLEYTDLRNADLSEADLRDADLRRSDLSGADLSEATLSGAKLWLAKLVRVNLSGANLSKARLSGVNLSGARLSGTNLSGANLSLANLSATRLDVANLSGASLWEVNLSKADLWEASLWEANLSEANLTETDLSRAKGLTKEQLSSAKLCRTKLPKGIDLDPDRDCPPE